MRAGGKVVLKGNKMPRNYPKPFPYRIFLLNTRFRKFLDTKLEFLDNLHARAIRINRFVRTSLNTHMDVEEKTPASRVCHHHPWNWLTESENLMSLRIVMLRFSPTVNILHSFVFIAPKIPMRLEITNLQKLCRINARKMKTLVKSILKAEKRDAELSIVFTDNKKIKEMNKAFLGHDYATDVLSFSYHEPAHKDCIVGEIIISVEMALKLTKKHKYPVEGEIALYLAHGLLHLLGYDDKRKKDARRMHQREGELLSGLGYDVPVPR